MPPADEGGGMPPPLAHGAGRGDAHRPEKEPLGALGAGDESVGAECAAHRAVETSYRAQLVIRAERIAHEAIDAVHELHLADVVGARINAHYRSLALGDARQFGWHEGPLLERVRRRAHSRPRRRK